MSKPITWLDQPWCIYDLETTGVDTATAKVVQIAIVIVQGTDIISRTTLLIDPGVPIPEEAAAIHGITDDMVAGKPTIEEVKGQILSEMQKHCVFAGYNNFLYDAHILYRDWSNEWLDVLRAGAHIDVLGLVRLNQIGKFWAGKGRHRLGAVAERLKVQIQEGKDLHEATTDCIATAGILRALLQDSHYYGVIKEAIGLDIRGVTSRMRQVVNEQQEDYRRYMATQKRQHIEFMASDMRRQMQTLWETENSKEKK